MTIGNLRTSMSIAMVALFTLAHAETPAPVLKMNQVIMGWREALKQMPTGAKWEIVIPSNLGYGERGVGGSIGPNETLVFEVELVGVK